MDGGRERRDGIAAAPVGPHVRIGELGEQKRRAMLTPWGLGGLGSVLLVLIGFALIADLLAGDLRAFLARCGEHAAR
jgi:hypothetical protein